MPNSGLPNYCDNDYGIGLRNAISGSESPVLETSVLFTETTGAGTYTGTVVLPAGAVVQDVVIRNDALWTATTSATMNVGDADVATGYFSGLNLKTTPAAATAAVPTSASAYLSHASGGAYKGFNKYYATGGLITGTIVTVGAAGNAGITRMFVSYTVPNVPISATKA